MFTRAMEEKNMMESMSGMLKKKQEKRKRDSMLHGSGCCKVKAMREILETKYQKKGGKKGVGKRVREAWSSGGKSTRQASSQEAVSCCLGRSDPHKTKASRPESVFSRQPRFYFSDKSRSGITSI